MADNEALQDLAEHISSEMEQIVLEATINFGELTLTAHCEHAHQLLKFLRDDPTCRFSQLMDICGADYPERTKRFDVVYHLLSMHQNQRIRVKVRTDEVTAVPTVTPKPSYRPISPFVPTAGANCSMPPTAATATPSPTAPTADPAIRLWSAFPTTAPSPP